MKINIAKATFTFSQHYEESVQEMIDDGMLKTQEDIKQYLFDCLFEDVGEYIDNNPQVINSIDFVIDSD